MIRPSHRESHIVVTLPYLRQGNKILEKDPTPPPRWLLGNKTVVFRRLALGDWKLHPPGVACEFRGAEPPRDPAAR